MAIDEKPENSSCLREDPGKVPAAHARPGSVMKYRGSILVVDDDPNVADLCRSILENDGHTACCASSAAAALARLEERAYDVLLAGLVMPEADGLWLLREAKNRHPDLA